ncbi:MAG: polymorphic outer membrane protein [Bacteroidota bacterium]|nr:polymorphic outer membrane protein [Bacteroidota bacterium]
MKKEFLLSLTLVFTFACTRANNYFVVNTNSTGQGSLAAAIDSANQNTGLDTIFLNLTAHDTIHVSSVYQAITDSLVITGRNCQNPTISGDSIYFDRSVIAAPNPIMPLTLNYLNITNCIDTNVNAAGAAVGAVQLNLNYCHFSGNWAYPNGTGGSGKAGAVNAGRLWAYNTTFGNNSSSTSQGPLQGFSGAVAVAGFGHFLNCTFTSNYSAGYAGALSAGRLEAVNCTFTTNHAELGGGVFAIDTALIANSIIWGNGTSTDTAQVFKFVNYPDNNVSSGGCNVLQDSTVSPNFTALSSDIINADPLLGALGYYSGCVPVIPIFCGSPAQDHATCNGATSSDAEGIVAHGVRDAGAFEITPAYLGANTIDSIQPGSKADLYNYFNTTGLTVRWYGNFADSTQVDTGTYTVIGTNFLGCSDTATVIIRYQLPDTLSNSINNLFQLVGFKMYPNPANNMVTIQWNQDISGSLELRLTDMTGRVLITENLNLTQWHYVINTSAFPPGIYCISLNTNGKTLSNSALGITHF